MAFFVELIGTILSGILDLFGAVFKNTLFRIFIVAVLLFFLVIPVFGMMMFACSMIL